MERLSNEGVFTTDERHLICVMNDEMKVDAGCKRWRPDLGGLAGVGRVAVCGAGGGHGRPILLRLVTAEARDVDVEGGRRGRGGRRGGNHTTA